MIDKIDFTVIPRGQCLPLQHSSLIKKVRITRNICYREFNRNISRTFTIIFTPYFFYHHHNPFYGPINVYQKTSQTKKISQKLRKYNK